jgi:hypothetical protein
MFLHHELSGATGGSSDVSENWAGYAATGTNGTFNSVTSNWVQPALNCAALPNVSSYSAYWVGIDGFSDQTVEQIGTEANCSVNKPNYYAWYEMYPLNPYELPIAMAINPGNQLTATVTYNPATYRTVRNRQILTSNANYTLSLVNITTKASYSRTLPSYSFFNRSSAEVIAEAPYSGGVLPLSDFGLVNFNNSLANGLPLGSFSTIQAINMQNPDGMSATTSSFDPTNKNFSVTWSNT